MFHLPNNRGIQHSLQWLAPKNLLCETGRHYLSAQLVSTIFVISFWMVLHIDVSPPKRLRNTALTSVVGAEKLTLRDRSSLLFCSTFLNDLCHINLVGATHRCFPSQTTEEYSTHFSGWRRKTYYARRVVTGRYYAANWFFRRGGCMR